MKSNPTQKSALTSFLSKPVNFYYMLLGTTLALTFIGLVMVFSASSIHSLETRKHLRNCLASSPGDLRSTSIGILSITNHLETVADAR